MIKRFQVMKVGFLSWCMLLVLWNLHAQTADLQFIHYTNQDGLPSSYVKDIAQDQFGFIWLANRANVCRFDGYDFVSFRAFDQDGGDFDLKANSLYRVLDSLLFCRSIGGEFYYFDYPTETFQYFDRLNSLGPVDQLEVSDSGDGVWYLQRGRMHYMALTQADRQKPIASELLADLSTIEVFSLQGNQIAVIYADSLGNERIGYVKDHQVSTFWAPFPNTTTLYLDQRENIWAGDSELGLCRIDSRTSSFEYYANDQPENRSLVHNLVHTFAEDHEGVLWIGTEGGLCRWNPNDKIFSRSEHSLADPKGLTSNPIYSAFCDNHGNVWLGMYFSGINLWSNQNNFFKTLSAGVGVQYLGGNAVSSFAEDEKGNIWIGLEDMGVNRLDWKTGIIEKYPVGIEKGGLSYGNIHDLCFTDPTHLWIATYTGGINILDVESGTISYVNTHNTPGLLSNDIYAFHETGDTIFVATISGVNVYSKSDKEFYAFYPEVFDGILVESVTQSEHAVWFSSRIGVYRYDLSTSKLEIFDELSQLYGINFIKSDSKGSLWVGDSFKGLFSLNETSGELRHYAYQNGFPGEWIYGMQEGADDWYWVSTDKGLVKLDPQSGTSFLFNKDSGIPFSQFNYRAAFRDSRDFIYFGSNEGLIYFDEYNQTLRARANPVVFTGMKLFNQPVLPLGSTSAALSKSLTLSEQVELDYEQNVFTIDFSALNYVNQGKCHYAYYLDGFEEGYNYVGNRNFASYTNLSPGRYTFRVMASLDNSSWDQRPTELAVVVHPPFWMSKLGYSLYSVILGTLLVLITFVISRIQKSRAIAEIERKERAHAVELNQIKLEFFTNISHELRTPLTLIIGPLVRLIEDEKVSPFVKKSLTGINLNAQRLLQLLNQLLDFRKIERGKGELKVSEQSMQLLFNNLEQSFAVTAEENQLQLVFNCEEAPANVWLDRSKVEKILINLISNAIKFTDADGTIQVKAKVSDKAVGGVAKQELEITIRDSGRGMEPRIINRIFDRFYQSDAPMKNSDKGYYGSGIGLAFVQSLVQVHRGDIKVRSKLEIGTVFKVLLPVSRSDYAEAEIIAVEGVEVSDKIVVPMEPLNETAIEEVTGDSANKPSILLVEDNTELREFIAGSLKGQYQMVAASNGQQGLEKLSEHTIDLILSDVMMPVMDGFEFTSKVKENFETSHIPVILLTAKSGVENRYEGLKTGADHYIEKPFLAHILLQNIYNVLKTRRSLIKRFKKDAMMPASELTYSESDKQFIENLTNIISENITKSDMDVGFLTKSIGLSRSMLHIKLKKIADCSATEFINTIRLKEALKLMSEKGFNVSEAAYQTGFSSPTYFTRRFKQYYGQSPRDFLQQDLSRYIAAH